jgi:hypothetical protein
MDQKQKGQGATSRPDVLLNVSETQIDELERQFNEKDRSAWNTLAESYGWTTEQGAAVWQWFSERPTASQGWTGDQGSGA